MMTPLKARPFLFFILVLAALPLIGYAGQITACSAGSNCVVDTSGTVPHGTTYYFNSLVINNGVTVTVGNTTNAAGGTFKMYVAGDANISGSIVANGGTAPNYQTGGNNPDGGGYGGGADANSCNIAGGGGGSGGSGYSGAFTDGGGGGGGVIQIYARNINIASTGTLTVNGGTGGMTNNGAGGGSGGTIRLYAGRITFSGTLRGLGGTGGWCGGGGAGGSLAFLSLTTANLTAGSMNFSGGPGGASGGSVSGGAGAGGRGGNGTKNAAGGIANPARNIRLYNVVVGGTFVISSAPGTPAGTGIVAGLMDAYLTPSNSKYSGLTVTYKAEKALFGAFNGSSYPTTNANFTVKNTSTGSALFSVLTGSDGTVLSNTTFYTGNGYDLSIGSVANNSRLGFGYSNSSGTPSGSALAISNGTTYGMYITWSGNQMAVNGGFRPTAPNATSFGGSSTNFSAVADLNNVTNLTLEKPGAGKIKFPSSYSVRASSQDYDSNVVIGAGFVSVNSSGLDPTFNSTATLTVNLTGIYNGVPAPVVFYYSGFANNSSAIIQGGSACTAPRCTGLVWNRTAQVVSFNVTGFSGYGTNGTSLPAYSTFGGSTTDFANAADLTNVAGMVLEKANLGRITFPAGYSVSAAGQDYDSNVLIGSGFISVNSSGLDSSFNSSTTLAINISGYKGSLAPDIYYYSGFTGNSTIIVNNGSLCIAPRCTNISWNQTTRVLTFNVTGFSDYGVNITLLNGASGTPFNNSGTIGINITSTNQIAVYTSNGANDSTFSFVPVVPPAAGSSILMSNETSNTTGGELGFLVENQGNVNVSITVASDKDAAAFIGGSTPLFQMFGGVNETNACPSLNTSMQDLSASAITICPSLAFSDSMDTIWAYVLVKIGSDSPPQTSSATLTFTSTAV